MKIHYVKTKKFKECLISFVFKRKLDRNIITESSMLIDNMVYSTKNYPTRKDLLKRYEYLYGSYISGRLSKIGDNMYYNFSLDFINPVYCDNGYLDEVLDMMLEVIYNPNIDNNEFDNRCFDINKNSYRDYLISIKENAPKYAYRRSLELLNSGNISYSMDGYLEDFDNITSKSLVNRYNELINDCELDIYIVGDLDNKYINNYLMEHIKDNKVKYSYNIYNKLNKQKEYSNYEEVGSYNQDTLILHYNLNLDDKRDKEIVLPVYNYIFGGGGLTSKLYDKVRESNSLCYTIYSFYNIYDGIFTIYAGIDSKNKDKCIELINECFKDMLLGNFNNKDISSSIKSLVNKYENYDTSLYNIYSYNFNLNNLDIYDIKTKIELIKSVTKEEIESISSKIVLNSIYLLKGDK